MWKWGNIFKQMDAFGAGAGNSSIRCLEGKFKRINFEFLEGIEKSTLNAVAEEKEGKAGRVSHLASCCPRLDGVGMRVPRFTMLRCVINKRYGEGPVGEAIIGVSIGVFCIEC